MKTAITNQMKLMLGGGVYLAVFLMVGTVFTLRAAEVIAMEGADAGAVPAVLEQKLIVEAGRSDGEGGSRDAAAAEDGFEGIIDTGSLLEPAIQVISRTGRRVIF